MPPTIDRATMQGLADLARLHLTADRLPVLRARLERIVAAFAVLAEAEAQAEADGAPAPPEPPAAPLRLRPDVPAEPLPLDAVLANAPHHAGGAFLVPRVIDA